MDATVPCNCYSKLRTTLQDTIRITDRSKLPVTGFAYGPFTSENAQAAVSIKSLECYSNVGLQSVTVLSDDCDAVTILSDDRLQFYMEYGNNTDCKAEIAFRKIEGLLDRKLKLTVSNFEVSNC